MDYARLSLNDVRTGLEAAARDAQTTFAGLDARQLNWRPDPAQWSVAQCFDHMVTVNRQVFHAADNALNANASRTFWQRFPVLPGLWGRMLVRSQAPEATRRFKAPAKGQPANGDIDPDVIRRFVEQHQHARSRLDALDERDAARAIMTSPFASFITYSVLDGWRLVLAHDRRHLAQARRLLT